MAFDEDVQVRMGLDRRPFDKALKGASGAMSTFKGALSALGVGFSLGAAKSFIGSILEMGDGLTRQSEALRVSTDFLQGWQAAASNSGSNSEEAAKALDKFSNHLAETGRNGADVQEEIEKLADRVSAAKTPIERIGIVSEAFGEKLGAKLIPALQGGSKALADFVANSKKLSAEDIKTLDGIGDAIDTMGRDAKVLGGSALLSVGKFGASLLTAIGLGSKLGGVFGNLGKDTAFVSNLLSAIEASESSVGKSIDAQALAAARRNAIQAAYATLGKEVAATQFESLSAEAQLGKLLEFRKSLLEQIAKGDKSVESAQKLVSVEKLSRDINERQKQIDGDRLKIAEAQANAIIAQGNAQVAVEKAKASFADAKQDRSGLTLQELATMRPQTRQGAQNANLANQALQAEEFAKVARANGRTDLAGKATDFALNARKRLEPLTRSERNPLAHVAEDMAGTREAVESLLDKASRGGLIVQPRNGD